MAVITPTITTDDKHVYRDRMNEIASFSDGVHIDFTDGVLAPSELVSIEDAWRHEDLITHAHIMHQDPLSVIDAIIHLEADLVILHAEADSLKEALEALVDNGTRVGVALLPETSAAELDELDVAELIEHVLVFGGNLGYQGGDADLAQLKKIPRIKDLFPDVEIGWDGGVNESNVQQIAKAGVDVINVGSAIKNADDSKQAYLDLVKML